MEKHITTFIVLLNAFTGFSQVPDTSKVIVNPLKQTSVHEDTLKSESTKTVSSEEVTMDMNELMIADSTLTSLGAKQIVKSDSTKIIYESIEPISEKRSEVKRNSKENKALVGPNLKEAKDLSMQALEERTRDYFKKQEAAPATFIIEGFPHQGVSVFLEGRPKSVHKAWKSYLYKTNKIKLKSKKAKSLLNRKKTPYYKATEVTLTNVTHRIGDVITVFQKENGLVKMTVIYKLGYNISVNNENFPVAYQRLTDYVEHFSQVNFVEYYNENLKNLNRSIKVVKKETKKETKVLKKLERDYKRAAKKGTVDQYDALAIDVQKKLMKTLAMEKSFYEYRIIQYKSKNSEVRMKTVD